MEGEREGEREGWGEGRRVMKPLAWKMAECTRYIKVILLLAASSSSPSSS